MCVLRVEITIGHRELYKAVEPLVVVAVVRFRIPIVVAVLCQIVVCVWGDWYFCCATKVHFESSRPD